MNGVQDVPRTRSGKTLGRIQFSVEHNSTQDGFMFAPNQNRVPSSDRINKLSDPGLCYLTYPIVTCIELFSRCIYSVHILRD